MRRLRRRRRSSGGVLAAVTVTVALGASLFTAGWFLTGGSMYTMTTTSMTPTIGVGSLILTRPSSQLDVGDVITFTPPNAQVSRTHRIVSINDTWIETKGDANDAVDQWKLPRSATMSKVVWHLNGLGWFYVMLPWLAIGSALWIIVVRRVRGNGGRALTQLWFVALWAIPIYVHQPLVRGVIERPLDPDGVPTDPMLTNTGLLPVHATVRDRVLIDRLAPNRSGELGIPVTATDTLQMTAALNVWARAAIIAVCVAPLVMWMLREIRRQRDRDPMTPPPYTGPWPENSWTAPVTRSASWAPIG